MNGAHHRVACHERVDHDESAMLLDDLGSVLQSSGEQWLIADGERRILWCTDRCREIHQALVTGGHLGAVPELAAAFAQAGDDLEPLVMTTTFGAVAASGSTSRFRLELTSLAGGRTVLRFVVITDDDAYLRRYMAEREQLFSTSRTVSVSEMATTLAHELNQPVGTVSNILKGVQLRLSRTAETPEEVTRALGKAAEQVSFIADIITRIRDFTQARRPSFTECNVHDLVTRSIDLLDWVFESEGVNVRLASTDETLRVTGDGTMLQQVLTNLCRNAVDAMRDNDVARRHLDVRVARTNDGVRIEIRDQGTGLSAEAEASVFMPFVTDKINGMGVGLNICRSFIELHQGRLWLTGNETGGCTAHVSLPDVGTHG